MNKDINKLIERYKNELENLENKAKLIRKKDPLISNNLGIRSNDLDPHIETLIKSVAFFCADLKNEIEKRNNNFFSEIINLIFPFYNKSIPSCCVVQFVPKKEIDNLIKLKRNTIIEFNENNDLFKFRTTREFIFNNSKFKFFVSNPNNYGIASRFNKSLVIEISNFHKEMKIFCKRNTLAEQIYSSKNCYFICNHGIQKIKITPKNYTVANSLLDSEGIVGDGIRMLFEFFCLPQWLNFFKIEPNNLCDCKNIKFICDCYIDDLYNDDFQLNCIPIVNLFNKKSEPFEILDEKNSCNVFIDYKSNINDSIISIDKVFQVNKETGEEVELKNYKKAISENKTTWISKESVVEFIGKPDKEKSFYYCDTTCTNKKPIDITNCSSKILAQEGKNFTLKLSSGISKSVGFHYHKSTLRSLFANLRGDITPKSIIKLFDLVMARCDNHKINDHHFIKQVNKKKSIKKVILKNNFCANVIGQEIEIVFNNSYDKKPPSYIFMHILSKIIQSYSPINTFTDVIFILESKEVLKRHNFKFMK